MKNKSEKVHRPIGLRNPERMSKTSRLGVVLTSCTTPFLSDVCFACSRSFAHISCVSFSVTDQFCVLHHFHRLTL